MIVAQDEIARRLELSNSTVSRSLSGHPGIHPETRARVLAMAGELGYRVREGGRGRRARPRSLATIGVLVGTGSFAHSPHPEAGQEMLSGMSDAATARDAMLDTHFVDPGEMSRLLNPAGRPAGWRDRAWRGAVLLYAQPVGVVEALCAEMPVVSLVHQYGNLAVDCIDSDAAQGMGQLVARLTEAGHRKLGFVNRIYRGMQPSWAYARFAGFVQALSQQGKPFLPEAMINMLGHGPIADEDLAREIVRLRREHGVTAFVCAADHQAFRVLRGLAEMGVSVPGEISITGFDGTPVPIGLPSLTTIKSPLREMGADAIKRLDQRLQDPGQPIRHIHHRGELIPGETVAAPAGT
jgi:LacI family transcriptional regulator